MGFLDKLFKPKWKDVDWRVRIEGVKELKNQGTLVKIAKNDDEWSVRRAAVEKISDESVLVDIAKNDPDYLVRRDAVEKISDESVLVDIAKNDSNSDVRKKAFENTNKYKNIDNFIKNSNDFYNDDLKEFERYNYVTSSIYNLENYQILLVKNEFSNKEFFTEWNDNTIYCQNKYVVGSHLRSKQVIEHEFKSVLYISEDLSSVDKITKRKYEYISKQISSKEELSPSTDDWVNVITTSSKFSNLHAIVIIGITDKITDLSEMFYGCKAETISFSNCDFSNVKNTKDIFYGCDNLKTIYADETSRDSLITFVPQSKKYISNIVPKSKKYIGNSKDNWYVCADCGKRVNQIALDIHKKCPHCGSINIREK